MRKLSTYIEYTLMTQHYAFVPGIGGFLLRDVDASYSKNVYTPSHREVHFNRFLTKDDGMLAHAIMTAEGISYDKAISQIRIDTAAILTTINKKKSFELGCLGTLTYDSDRHLVLHNAKQYPLDPEYYGLRTLNIRPWQEVENDSRQERKDVIAIPKYWIRRAVAIAIIILCFFANFNTDKDSSQTDYATMFNTNIFFNNVSPKTLTEESWDNSWEEETTLAEIETTQETQSAIKAEKLYYIIIASCTSSAEAERAVRNRQKQGFENIGILEMDGRFRLYIKSFTDRTEGNAYLEEVRTTTPFKNAWLLPVRSESLLSYYLKNFDNDQFPMELSHPHQRTERDQGWINT